MNADQMMRMEPLDILKMLREQVNMAIDLLESKQFVLDDDVTENPKVMLIGDFEIKPRFE